MTVAGTWDAITQSPIGPQNAVLTLTGSDDGFTGTSAAAMGSAEIGDGSVSGDDVTFKMKVTAPFPMTITVTAKLDGDTMKGQADTGSFGKMDFAATRKG